MVAKVKLFRLPQTPASWSKKHKERINEKKSVENQYWDDGFPEVV